MFRAFNFVSRIAWCNRAGGGANDANGGGDPAANETDPARRFPAAPVAASNLSRSRSGVQNHGFGFEGIPNFNLQGNRRRSPNFRQIQSQQFQQLLLLINRFRIFHGGLINMKSGRHFVSRIRLHAAHF